MVGEMALYGWTMSAVLGQRQLYITVGIHLQITLTAVTTNWLVLYARVSCHINKSCY